jgi:hypothetical protein
MKWVLRTSRVIVGTDEGKAVFRSIEECPPDVLRKIKETLPGPNACTIMITNREAMEAIRSRTIPVPRQTRKPQPQPAPRQEGITLPRWQIMAGTLLGTIAALTALLVWAMHSG